MISTSELEKEHKRKIGKEYEQVIQKLRTWMAKKHELVNFPNFQISDN